MLKIIDGKIYSETSANTRILSAIEIFDCIEPECNISTNNHEYTKNEFQSLGISFYQYPIDCKIVLEYNNITKDISYKIIASKPNQFEFPINFDILNPPEYIIYSNTWYPLKQHMVIIIANLLGNANISDSRHLTFQQYLHLNKASLNNPVIYNKVSSYELNEAISQTGCFESPKALKSDTILREYQKDGFSWMNFMANHGIGCILADEMGLGKTLQVIALMCEQCNGSNGNHLIIAPTSLLENWRRELLKFAPSLTFVVHKGRDRACLSSELKKYNVVITSYDTAVMDISFLRKVSWGLVVLDEAHYIRNPQSNRAITLKTIPKYSSVAVTGTPISNKLRDMWSIIDFVFPSYLGSLDDFESNFSDDNPSASKLEPIVSPLLLRRTVEMVGKFLPPLVEIPQCIEMDSESAFIYDSMRRQGGAGSFTLSTMQPLRQFCTHPWVADQMSDSNDICQFSNKTQRLFDILEEVFVSGQKVLIFTSFHKSIDILKDHLRKKFNVYTDFIDGRVSDSVTRQLRIDQFQAHQGSGILLLNPDSAGVGLNITAANHVIHFNPVWNPTVEDQATARAYRMGQTKPVFVHRLYYKNTVEQIMDDRMRRKRSLAEAAVVGTDGKDARDSVLSIFSDADELNDLKNAKNLTPLIHST